MSGRSEHPQGWRDELAAHILGVLDGREAKRAERHLAGCEACREWVGWLAPAVDMLPATVAQQDPPPALRDRLMAIVEEEAAPVVESATPRVAAPQRRSWLQSFSGLSLRPALAGLGVAMLLAAGVVIGSSLGDDDPSLQARTYAAVPVSGGSPAEGTLTVEGDSGSLDVRNLPPTRRHEVYQAWIRRTGDGGGIVPSTPFVLAKDGSGHVRIPSGLEGAQEVLVTREPVGGSEKPHESPLILAKLEAPAAG